jgi:hypothetical protein
MHLPDMNRGTAGQDLLNTSEAVVTPQASYSIPGPRTQ